ncbi:MAG TPA: hypothetical protein VMR62_33360 [Bryobacteraceae bacterium]|nr:hypothetical protein [Bryobacteraceae bacterium]
MITAPRPAGDDERSKIRPAGGVGTAELQKQVPRRAYGPYFHCAAAGGRGGIRGQAERSGATGCANRWRSVANKRAKALFYLGRVNYQLGKMTMKKTQVLEAARFSQQVAAIIRGSLAQQAVHNARVMKDEVARRR